jgi:hypothetical protein
VGVQAVSVIRSDRFGTAATSQALRDERKAPDSQWLPPHTANELRAVVEEQAEIIGALVLVIATLRGKADA